MEQANSSTICGVYSYKTEDVQIKLPPGFRFHPTDEELITHYLSKKVVDNSFDPAAIGEVDLNKNEPWELPRIAKLGEKEWYFFTLRDRKYLTGLRMNRATGAGYWKATGKDKKIYRGRQLVGMKKTLVFYRGRAPRGQKSNWVMHEYRLEGKCSVYSHPRAIKNEWVICRIIKKSLHGNGKTGFTATEKTCSSPYGEAIVVGPTPSPLVDIQAHVTCFSSHTDAQNAQNHKLFSTSPAAFRCCNPSFQSVPVNYSLTDISTPSFSMFTLPSSSLNSGGFMNLLESDLEVKQRGNMGRKMLSVSQETGLTSDMYAEISSSNVIGRSGFEDCLWNY